MSLLSVLLGAILGGLLYKIYLSICRKTLDDLKHTMLLQAQEEAKAHKIHSEQTLAESEQKFIATTSLKESELRKKEEQLERDRSRMQEKRSEIERKERALFEKLQKLTIREEECARREGCTKEELQKELKEELEKECSDELMAVVHKAKLQAKETARQYLLDAIGRLPSELVVSTTVELPNDEIKAKLIGRGGKNCKAFMDYTGVDLIIDDTRCIQLSSFNPERREVAKQALHLLIERNRITPPLIQEAVTEAQKSLDALLIGYGETATRRCGVVGLHPELIRLIGLMAIRKSYSQNLLEHSVEVSELMGLVAAELGLDGALARRIGLLHDIGKVLSVEYAPTHARAGYKFALEYGESELVANGIGCHHGEMAPSCPEAILCAPCDALSAMRPGARSDSSERYFDRITALEKEALSFAGVEKAFVYQGGKELRVFVCPSLVDDLQATRLAQAISRKIQESVSQHVQVTVVREVQSRALY